MDTATATAAHTPEEPAATIATTAQESGTVIGNQALTATAYPETAA